MMKIKEVSAGVKISKNYNSYSVNLVADLENKEVAEKVGEDLIKKAEKIVFEKIELIGKKKFVEKEIIGKEVGAAWFSKKSYDKLSIKDSKTGSWEEVDFEDLERVGEGYKREIDGEIYFFKRIPEDKRTRNMPIFRIYKMEDSDNFS